MDKIGISEGSFEWALMLIKNGSKMKRKGWNGQDQYIELVYNIKYTNSNGEECSSNEAIAFNGNSGVQVGWLASQADMLANDWEMI